MSGETTYVLGHSDHELERLLAQASILRPVTRRLLAAAGVGPGMRVLDVGTGAGDVALLAAEMVGEGGSVVGLDDSAAALAVAAKRAADAGLSNLRFHRARAETYEDAEPFDVVVGRYVLLFQADPVAFMRSLTSKMTPGGIIAFHEIYDATDLTAIPQVPHFTDINSRVFERFRSALPHHDVASRLYNVFRRAGLPGPRLSCERIASGDLPNPIVRWLVLTYMTMFGNETAGPQSLDAAALTLELERAIDEQASQVASPEQWCAWARLA